MRVSKLPEITQFSGSETEFPTQNSQPRESFCYVQHFLLCHIHSLVFVSLLASSQIRSQEVHLAQLGELRLRTCTLRWSDPRCCGYVPSPCQFVVGRLIQIPNPSLLQNLKFTWKVVINLYQLVFQFLQLVLRSVLVSLTLYSLLLQYVVFKNFSCINFFLVIYRIFMSCLLVHSAIIGAPHNDKFLIILRTRKISTEQREKTNRCQHQAKTCQNYLTRFHRAVLKMLQ